MVSKDLNIISTSNNGFILHKQNEFSHAFRYGYAIQSDSNKPSWDEKKIMKMFSMTDWETRSLKIAVDAQISSYEAQQKELEERITELEELLADEESSKRERFKYTKKLARLRRRLGKQIVFGSYNLIKKITKEYNKPIGERDDKKIAAWEAQYSEKRTMSLFVVGEAPKKGNRYFNFSRLAAGIIIYKPNRYNHIEIKIKVTKWNRPLLLKLQKLAMDCMIPISVSLSNDNISLSYEESFLNGYEFKETEMNREIKEIRKKNKGLADEELKRIVNDCRIKYHREQENRMFVGKKVNRYISIDMNPTNIGYVVFDVIKGDEIKIIEVGEYDMSLLAKRLSVASNHYKQLKQNDKRKYELTIVLKKIFNIANHYGCSRFVIEDLNTKYKDGEEFSKEANRKIKNLWNKDLTLQIIRRRCSVDGIKLIEVNPCHSSFIGNVQHPYEDAASAACEIGRRGTQQYIKNGKFYPIVTDEDMDTLKRLFGSDALCSTDCNWVEIYKSCKSLFEKNSDFEHRFRTANVYCDTQTFRMQSRHSGVIHKVYTATQRL